ncbi:MAG: phosphoribosylglycinamide formyltransferase [Phycisphaerales bacterium]|nr:phosphoribosylglycinamide formyltransferase [Planctomycetota bacterium]MCH8507361.1 phosphoribosylglycinamide formyltransferase [Phycisphaerales bacterium]
MPAKQARNARLLVLLSGSGRTLENLLARIDAGELPAEIVRVVASKPCRGADIARARDIPTDIIPGSINPEALDDLVARDRADWIVLAGYLRLVPITPTTRGRIVNIHPALLPAFGGPGMHGMKVHAAAIDAYRRGEITESGCTVHLADDTYDTGPIILQRRCPITPDDTPETLAAKVFNLELEAYPAALKQLITSATG